MNESVAKGPMVAGDALTTEPVAVIEGPPRVEFLRRHWPSLLAVGVILLFVVAFIFRDSLSPFSASAVRPTRALLPVGSADSPLGTDGLGRDLFARILAGVPFSLLFRAGPAASGMVIGAAIGLVPGCAGGNLARALLSAQ